MNRWIVKLAAALLLGGCGLTETGSLRKAETAVAQIEKGTLSADAEGVVALPSALRGASVDGRAYVTTVPSGKQWILFRTWIGKGANLRGFLFTAGDTPPIGMDIQVTTECTGSVVPADVVVDDTVSKSWYRVSRSMD